MINTLQIYETIDHNIKYFVYKAKFNEEFYDIQVYYESAKKEKPLHVITVYDILNSLLGTAWIAIAN